MATMNPHGSALRFIRCALALSAVLTAGCPNRGCPLVPHSDPQRALRMHRSLHRTIGSLRAEARVDQRGRDGRVRGTVLMLLERPNRVRFDALTQFGPAAILTSDGEAFQLLDHRERRFLEGPACRQNIARLLGIHMTGAEVAQFLIGDTPRIDADEVSLSCGAEGYVITRHASDGRRQEIVLAVRDVDRQVPPEEQHLRLLRSELFDASGETSWRVTFDDYRVVVDPRDAERRGVALPFVLRFEDPRRGADTVVRFKEMALVAEPLPTSTFAQPVPPGMMSEHVTCDG